MSSNWKSSDDLNWQWSMADLRKTATDEPVVRAGFLAVFGDYCRTLGLNPNRTYLRAGLTYDMISEADVPVPLVALSELFELAAADLDDPVFGLHFAEWVEPGHFGLVDQLILSAESLDQAWELTAHYIETTISQMQLHLTRRGALVSLSGRLPSSLSIAPVQFADFLVATLVLRGKAVIGATWQPTSVALTRRAPEDISEFRRVLGARLEFGASELQIVMRREEIDVAMPSGWPGLGRTVRQTADTVLRDVRAGQDFVAQVKRIIGDRLNDDLGVGLEAVANALRLSPRALQWRLSRHQVSYDSVLRDVRVRLAVSLLRDTSQSLADIGRNIGLSEGSAFTRWAKVQFDMPPSAYRKILRAQK